MTLVLLNFLTVPIFSQVNEDKFEQNIFLPKQKSTIYNLLSQISKQSGILFIYDSKVIDNECVVKIKDGDRHLKDAIIEVVGNKDIRLEKIGKHILITKGELRKSDVIKDSLECNYIMVEGQLVDLQTNEPIAYGSIGIKGSSIGTISNQNGVFKLIIPESLSSSYVSFSHLGYEPQSIIFSSLQGHFANISLQSRVLSLPEVVIQAIDPVKLIHAMRRNISKNYFMPASYLTSFYREGVDYNNKFRSLTEAVIKLYKPSYRSLSSDQVHLLKMRKISSYTLQDTLIAKMSSGIDASLKLDVIKELPDFLNIQNSLLSYTYNYVESTIIDGESVDVISFTQKKSIVDPRYAGKLYIKSDDYALVRVEMNILPEMVRDATDMFVSKQAQSMKLTANKINYVINYKKFGDYYFINHVRGDLYFKAKKRKKLFAGSSMVHTWFEMLPCKIDTMNVVKFNKSERISPYSVFSETTFEYDPKFWGEYNTIPLEQKIEDVIQKLSPKIEVIK